MGNGQVTIKDLAKILGVAPSTVSRALKNHPDISKETKKQVNDLARKMQFEPNPIAISLRGHRTMTVGVIIPEFVHHFFSTVISGIERVALDAGYNVLVCCSNASFEREVAVTRLLLNRRVDGLLLCISKNALNTDHLGDAMARNVPIVMFDNVVQDFKADKVIIDDTQAAYQAVKHLVREGCKSIAYIGGSPSLDINQKRFEGYRQALNENGIAENQLLIKHVERGDVEDGTQAARELLDQGVAIDGLFATADMPAIGAIKQFKKSKLRVPQDIAVVGFSNWKIAEVFDPQLTTVNQPGGQMGSMAMNMLLKRMNGLEDGPQTKVLDTELLIRESSVRK